MGAEPEVVKSQETATVQQLSDEAASALTGAARSLCYTRSKAMQKEQRQKLFAIKERIRGFKRGAARAGSERGANQLFHIQCVLNAVISHLDMLVQVKGRDYHRAWDNLINAYEYLSVAERASPGFPTDYFRSQLEHAEKAFFPSVALYQSWGVLLRGGICSVCGKPFHTCDHLEGRVYWGKLCVRLNAEVTDADHVALVDDPRDRRCIITEQSSDDGQMHDHFTWNTKGKAEIKDGALRKVSGVFYHSQAIEID